MFSMVRRLLSFWIAYARGQGVAYCNHNFRGSSGLQVATKHTWIDARIPIHKKYHFDVPRNWFITGFTYWVLTISPLNHGLCEQFWSKNPFWYVLVDDNDRSVCEISTPNPLANHRQSLQFESPSSINKPNLIIEKHPQDCPDPIIFHTRW